MILDYTIGTNILGSDARRQEAEEKEKVNVWERVCVVLCYKRGKQFVFGIENLE